MKANSTLVYIIFYVVVLFSSSFSIAKAQCTAPALVFANPQLIAGSANQVNAVYKFPSVITGVDALVKITGAVNGATLTSIDDNTFGYSDAWQPVVKTPLDQGAIESYMTFKIDFVKSADGATHTFICFTMSAIDVDGDAVHVREMVAANDFTSYGVSNATTLTLTNQASLLKATSSIVNCPGIDTSAYVTNMNYRYVNKSKISEVQIGSVTDPTFSVQDRYSCIYFRPIIIPNVVVLPIQYLALSLTNTGNKVQLNWLTNEKTDRNSFTIERSFDGSNFSAINTAIESSGKENLIAYQAVDVTPEFPGQSYLYYRIKQVDASGKVAYSNLSYVHLQELPIQKMTTAPNPFTEKIIVQFNSSYKANAEIRLETMAGVTWLQKQFIINTGSNNISIDGLAAFNKGIYVARLIVNGKIIETKKIIK